MNIPPTPETIERVNNWGDKLCSIMRTSPWDVRHSDDPDRTGMTNTHVFLSEHGTLPGRILHIIWGIPIHKEGCECIEPPTPRLTIYVMDADTEAPVPESGELELENPVVEEALVGITMMAITAFHTFGNI